MNDKLIKALSCTNTGRPPVWLMRQAGRSLPAYRELRARHTLWQMFHESEIAARVTRLPIDLLGMDAAILFSDILVIAEAFNVTVVFPEQGGPFIDPALAAPEDIQKLQAGCVQEKLSYVKETIALVKPSLKVPLIGFCGGPFTVASYWIKKDKIRTFLEHHPAALHELLEKITQASIDYLRMQIEAGVDAVQIFDSWASLLTREEFHEFSLPYLRKISSALTTPVILFCRGSSQYPLELASLSPRAISFDEGRPLRELRQIVPSSIAVQGNLSPETLKQEPHLVRVAVQELLASMRGQPGFIFNLGHGVLPDTPFKNLQVLVDAIHAELN